MVFIFTWLYNSANVLGYDSCCTMNGQLWWTDSKANATDILVGKECNADE